MSCAKSRPVFSAVGSDTGVSVAPALSLVTRAVTARWVVTTEGSHQPQLSVVW